MKNLSYKISIVTIISLLIFGCNDFLDVAPQGSLNPQTLANKKGVDALLTSAYGALDGQTAKDNLWFSDLTNWVYGDVASDDAVKGSESADQSDITQIETWNNLIANNTYVGGKWRVIYEGITRCNDVIKILPLVEDIPDNDKKAIEGEARFLRAHYHFEAKRTWNMVPYIDENITDVHVPNDKDIWPMIEEDFQYAINNLPVEQPMVGKATKGAAEAYLARVYLYEGKYAESKPLLDSIIQPGNYQLTPNYNDNFNFKTENNSETIFAIQASGTEPGWDNNPNLGRILNAPMGGPGGCCGFLQVSQDFVNAHRTDANGLPYLDDYNDISIPEDSSALQSYPVDPRLDYTVCRDGVPYLDYDVNFQKEWERDLPYGGPFHVKKMLPTKEEKSQFPLAPYFGNTVTNFNIIRYADVLLMRAEVAAWEGDLNTALQYVNIVRQRAMNSEVIKYPDGTPAANFNIGLYTSFPDKETALKAVKMERRIELGMEGQRFFDLVRWGEAEQVMNKYFDFEKAYHTYLQNAQFSDFNNYYPIPTSEIDLSSVNGKPTLSQNPGY